MSKYFYPLLAIIFSLTGTSSYGSVTIDSVVAHRSLCSNSGYIDIYAHGTNPPILYGIKSGPVTRQLQSSPSIQALPPGTYTVMAVNFAGDTAVATTTISGNYLFPDFTLTYKNPICPRSGIIVGKASSGKGLKPFKWELTNTGTGSVITQAADTFKGLDAGSYSLRIYDSCESYTTKAVTLLDAPSKLYFFYADNNVLNCDSVGIYIDFHWTGTQPPLPISGFVRAKGRIIPSSQMRVDLGGNYIGFQDTIQGITYGDTISFSFTDGCGNVINRIDSIDPYKWRFTGFFSQSDSCVPGNIATFSMSRLGYIRTYTTPGTFYTVTDSVSGALVASGSFFGTSFSSSYLKPSRTYKFVFWNGCGDTSRISVTPPAIVVFPPRVSAFANTSHCRDSVAGVTINYSSFTTEPYIRFLSGPRSVRSTKPLFAYSDPIIIYDTTYATRNTSQVRFTNLAAGKYVYQIGDSCGHVLTDSFILQPQHVTADFLTNRIIKGCPGENKLIVTMSTIPVSASNIGSLSVKKLGGATIKSVSLSYGRPDTTYNLDYGKYVVTISRSSDASFYGTPTACKTIFDTIEIVPYTPPQISYVTVLKCNGQLYVILNPDSTHGVAPYQYEVINGPETFARQSSNVFIFSQRGNYTARIIDTCNNAQTYFFTVDTITKPRITVSGPPCFGNSIKLIGERSPYFEYQWVRPNGSYYEGDSLDISPITPGDTGTYKIVRINHINNCLDSTLSSYELTGSIYTEINATICGAQTVTVNNHVYHNTGTYYDTIPTRLCDSIIVLNLELVDHLQDSTVKHICAGDTARFGGRLYTQGGIYRDTFATTWCDSISVMYLLVQDWGRDTSTQSICSGQSVQVGNHTYTQTGVYTDTLVSGNCRSVHLLNLTVSSYKLDSMARSVCEGQNVIVGTHSYDQTGVYRDTFTTTAGCDSIVELHLTRQGGTDSIARSVCEGEEFTWGGTAYTQSGVYTYTVADGDCDSIHIVNLRVNPLPLVTASSDKTAVGVGDTVALSTNTPNLVYQWVPPLVLNNASVQNPTAIIDSSTWFIVVGTDSFTSCSSRDSVFVLVENRDCEGKVAIPSGFTPNGDQHNDHFEVIWLCTVQQFEVTIYNRWGQKIFESKDPAFAWDGTYGGVPQPSGTYAYYIKATGGNGKEIKFTNSITIIR